MWKSTLGRLVCFVFEVFFEEALRQSEFGVLGLFLVFLPLYSLRKMWRRIHFLFVFEFF